MTIRSAVCAALLAVAAVALAATAPLVQAQEVVIPNLVDPQRRIDRPNLSGVGAPIRFLTAHDHPPFNFVDANGEPSGFHVELVRAICLELRVACTLQARSFDVLLAGLRENRGDAVIAGVALSPEVRLEFDVGDVYLRSPARFAVRRDSALRSFVPEELDGRRIGAQSGTAHAAYLETFFPGVRLTRFDSQADLRAALKSGAVDGIFADAVGLAFWTNGSESANCCELRGGPYLESRYFGEGYAAVFRPGADVFRRAVNHALQRIAEKGTFAELYLRWFPVSLY